MQARSLPVLIAAALVGDLPAAHADDSQIRQALQANDDRIGSAFRDHKTEVMDSLLAPGATLTTPEHKTWSRDRILTDFKRQSYTMKNATWTRKVTGLKVHSDEAVVTVKGAFHSVFSQGDAPQLRSAVADGGHLGALRGGMEAETRRHTGTQAPDRRQTDVLKNGRPLAGLDGRLSGVQTSP